MMKPGCGYPYYEYYRHVFLKLNSGVRLTSKATDWAPEVGLVFSFGGKN